MSHRTSLANNEGLSVSHNDTAQAVGQPPTSSPPTMQRPVQIPDTGINNSTSTPSSTSAITAFFISMKSHYESLSDLVTPHLFTQLCKDYNTSKTDETSFYVAAYRLFYETNATHLMPGLRAFLPATWREVDMEWLDKAVEGDSERQRASAREAFGEIAVMAESGMSVPSTPSGFAVAKKRLDVEASATQPMRNKKRTPLKGFRATYRTDIETPSRSGVPTPRSDSGQSPTAQSSPASTPLIPRGHLKTTHTSSPPTKRPPSQKNKASSSATASQPGSNDDNTPTPGASTPPPINKASKLPSASSIVHLGTVYPTTRAIIARSHKPYIHALCGMAFGHPAEVQRHHNGQGGRPGCWEKSGKPARDEGRWDRDDSCKVKLAEVQYVKVQEGWVVTSWGSAAIAKVLGEDAGEELEGGMAKLGTVKAGEEKKRKAGAKPQRAPQVETRATSEDEDESLSEDDEGLGDCTEPLSPQEPGSKRQKASKSAKSAAIVSEEHAATARAVALGLRTRK